MESYGILSLLPPLVAIVLAFLTRQVILSLFIAVWLGATILNGFNPGTGLLRALDQFIVGNLADSWNAAVLIYTMILAGMIALMAKSGGALAIAEGLAKKAKNSRAAQLAAWAMGLVIFFDDYSNTLIVGNSIRPLTDKMRVSREKLSYIVDSTAAPVASMALISTWIGYEMGLIKDGFDSIGVTANIYGTFLSTIPFRFYSIFALILVVIIALTLRDYGPMYEAEVRARTTGKLLRDGAQPLAAKDLTSVEVREGTPIRWYNAVLPILTVIVVTFVGLYINGGGASAGSIRDAVGNADSSVVLLWASILGTFVAMILVIGQKILTLTQAIDIWVDGAKSVFTALIILIMAWSLGGVSSDLGTANYIVQVAQGNIAPWLIPVVIFLICCVMAFACGTSWGVTAIVMPLAIPLAHSLGAPMSATIGAVLTGAIFGDHCSPLSDTTILSSMASAADHMDHVRTQIPYAITAAIVGGIVGFIPAGFGINPVISLVIGVVVLYGIVRVLGKSTYREDLEVDPNISA